MSASSPPTIAAQLSGGSGQAATGPATASGGATVAEPGFPAAVGCGAAPPLPAADGGERVQRPWGWYETLLSEEPAADGSRSGYGIKRLWIAPGNRISLQRHQHRSEHWVVVAGSGWLDCGGSRFEAAAGTTLEVPPAALHRASAGSEGLLIIEVQRGMILREDDIERVADDYGRVIGSSDSL